MNLVEETEQQKTAFDRWLRARARNFSSFIVRAVRLTWRLENLPLFLGLVVFIVISIFLSHTPERAGISELQTAAQASSFRDIASNPVNAPHKLLTLLLTELSPSVRSVRVVSMMFATATAIAMFYMLKHWHKPQTAVLTTAAFAGSAIVLAVGRLGTPVVTVMSFYAFAGLLLWDLHTRSNKAAPIVVLMALAALLYVPGFVWFALIVGIVYGGRLRVLFRHIRLRTVLFGTLLAILLIVPLVHGFVREAGTINEWLLLPPHLDWAQVPRSILRVPSAFIYRMPTEPLVNVGRLPVFDVASGLLFLVGLNAYRQKLRLDRTRVMLGSALVAVIIGALGQTLLAVVFLLPFAFSVIAAGIEYLLDEWYAVFPRNPLARSFGLIIITSTILFSTYYQLTRFFVVWPQAPETRATYNQSRILSE